MQQYAEQACYDHVVKYLQPEFNKGADSKLNFPYSRNLSQAEVKRILQRNVRQSERYRVMKDEGKTDEEIERAFNTPVSMSIFTYSGERDTIMSPMDSIRHYKSFFRRNRNYFRN